MTSPAAPQTRAGFVALIGAPNAGKSTLLNRLVGAKVSIVTPKVQTTRARIRAIAMHGETQIVFVDTPGIFAPRRRLDRAMVEAAWGGAADADVICVLVDAPALAARPGGRDAQDTTRIIEGLKAEGRRALLVLNKVDAIRRDQLLPLAARLSDPEIFEETFMVSAASGDGVDDLLNALAARMKPGPWLYPPDQLADFPERLLAAEIVREKLFLRMHDELPYALTVEVENWENRTDGSARIEAVVFVQRDSQKAIVLGRGGRAIKDVGAAARGELEALLGRRVHLFLFVKVRDNWIEDPERYRAMGLDFPKG